MSHVERLARLQGNRCFLCGGPLAEPVNVDHVIPNRISEHARSLGIALRRIKPATNANETGSRP